MNEHPERLDLRSHDASGDKIAELLRLFPEVRTEGGKLDFDRLKLALGESVDVGKERYGMNWPGKAECFKTIQTPSLGALRPCPEESVNFDTTENLIIEGDNLEVLKLMQKSYLGKVKMIYIDPPYNTGNDFIYPDNYTESLHTYLEYTGQIDAEGRKFGTNTEADGRFHSKWLNMMYPRLYLARNLLREDGVIFISIDDHELDNLLKTCNEVFGEENHIATLVWEKGRKNDARRFSVGHEYLVGFAKNLLLIEELVPAWREPKEGVAEIVDEYHRLKQSHGDDYSAISAGLVAFYQSLPEDHPSKKYSRSRFVDKRGIWRDNNISWPGGGGPRYDLLHPRTKKPCKVPDDGWRFVEETMQAKVRNGYVEFREDHTKTPFLKSYLYIENPIDTSGEDSQGEKLQVMGSVFYRHSQPSNDVLKELFGEKIFENPKDHDIIARLVKYCTDENSIVLDFFAGSGTTAQSVIEVNEKTGGNRTFILVQLPEPTGRTDYATIADICKERVRCVIAKLDKEDFGKLNMDGNQKQYRGFRVFKLAESNFTAWDAQVAPEPGALEKQLEFHVDHIRDERTADDILYELLLKSGFPLTTPVETHSVADKTVYSVAGGALMICLEPGLTLELIRVIADRKPERVVCLDEGFAGNDQLKANAVQTFKTKGVTSFKTV
ncbi:MAG: site-specific DNA-methyltransferase [Planctomyces sp.]|nr:site-specific DNA-methyltransferase [Planctomyces sp.]